MPGWCGVISLILFREDLLPALFFLCEGSIIISSGKFSVILADSIICVSKELGGKMKKITLLVIIAVSLLTTACAVPPAGDEEYGSPGYGDTMPAPLPPLVILEAEPYYFHNGYHYHYLNGRWFYSRSRSGPWTDLPRRHYPREVRYKDRDGGRGYHEDSSPRSRDWERDRDSRSRERDRDRDRRDDYDSHNRDRY
jgi:hypothetical protein